MPISRQSKFARFALALAIAAGALGSDCDGVPQIDPAASACSANVAMIFMWDGKLQKVCGCGGTDGEFYGPGSALGCTFSLGKTLFVYYQGPFLQHQFDGTGTPEAADGPPFDPNSNTPIRSHAWTPTAAGTYTFRDVYDNTLTGTITVTP